jgi:hypothetical protein
MLTGPQVVKKFPAFYGTRRFIVAFTSDRHLSLSWASSIQSMPPHPTSLQIHFIIIPSTLRSSKRFLLSGHPTKALRATLLSAMRAACPAHLINLDVITRMIFGEEYRSLSSSLCSLLHSPVTSSVLGSNILTPMCLRSVLSSVTTATRDCWLLCEVHSA